MKQHSAGRSNLGASPHYPTYNYSSVISPAGSVATAQQSASLTARSKDGTRAGAHSLSSSARPYQRPYDSRAPLRSLDTSMGSNSNTQAVPQAQSGHGRLHKRGGSGSSLPSPPSPLAHSQFTTPFATYEEGHPATPPTSSTPKIKPYIRKMSSSSKQDDQGRLDLSKSTSENERLAGLGIQDFGNRSVSDVSFSHAARRGTHGRTTSVGSQVSNGSGSYRPSQTFVHPMRQTPRPYTPPTGSSNASFVNEDFAEESDDVIDDDFRLGHFRSKRSMSITSVQPTPLSQSHTAEDLGLVPKLTSPSYTNLSIKSGKSSKSRHGRPRRDTERSYDAATSPSSRTSFDHAFSFVSRKSDPESQTRDERIRAARRKFEEKEAHKDRKLQGERLKRRETEESKTSKKSERRRRKSESADRARPTENYHGDGSRGSPRRKKDDIDEHVQEKVPSRSYDEYRASPQMSLPRQGREAGMSEKTAREPERKANAQTGWVRFSAWMQTRMLSCGGKR